MVSMALKRLIRRTQIACQDRRLIPDLPVRLLVLDRPRVQVA